MFAKRIVLTVALLGVVAPGCAAGVEPVVKLEPRGEQPATKGAAAAGKTGPATEAPAERAEDITSRYHAEWKRRLAATDVALAKNPKDAEAHAARARLYLQREAYELALGEVEKALAIDADFAKALSVRAMCHRHLGEPEKARADFRRAVALKPDDGGIVSAYAAFLSAQDQPALALAEAYKAVDLAPKSANARNNLGLILKKQNAPEKALDALNEATRLDPNYPYPYFNRGQIYAARGDHFAALAEFDRVVELDPTHAWAYRERETIYKKLGFPCHAFHNERVWQVMTGFRDLKKKLKLAVLDVPTKEFVRRVPGTVGTARPGRSEWPTADTALLPRRGSCSRRPC